jgi:spore maturation protein SpmB
MPIITIAAGALLSLLGILGYVFSESHSLTALIPLAFGSLLEACGALALRPALKKHAMHGASVLALLGVAGSATGFVSYLKKITGSDVARPLAAQMQAAMFVICLVFLVLCIRSFREARAQRLAGGA